MKIKVGSRVKVVGFVEPDVSLQSKEAIFLPSYCEKKKASINKEGTVYGNPHKYYDGYIKTGLPQGETFYSIKDDEGKDITPYGWFAKELQLIEKEDTAEDIIEDMKEFDCHFEYNAIVQTHGRDEEGAMENIEKILNQDVIHGAENIMNCGVDFNRENIIIKEVENGWFELTLLWSGYWTIEGKDEATARKIAQDILNDRLTPFYQMLEVMADKQRRFGFKGIKDEKITDVLE